MMHWSHIFRWHVSDIIPEGLQGQSRENKGKQGVREVQGVIEGRINEIIKGYSREIGKDN